MGRTLPRAALDTVGDSVEALEVATWAIPAVERLVDTGPDTKPVWVAYPLSRALATIQSDLPGSGSRIGSRIPS